MGVTSRDVARLAGVSQPTVSRALRDDPRVSEETKQRVREAAALLNYVPSDVGRALSSGRTRRIGLLVTDLDNEFYAHIIAPMHRELERRGYQLMLHTEAADNEAVVERLLANGLDGVILATTTLDAVVPLRLRDRGMPFVYFNRVARIADADAAVVSPFKGLVRGGVTSRCGRTSPLRRGARTRQHEHRAGSRDRAARGARQLTGSRSARSTCAADRMTANPATLRRPRCWRSASRRP